MIYMVDHVYTDSATEQAWHDWYGGYLRKLVSVPGIHTAQRFKAIGQTPSRYLAMYTIDSARVYESEAYRNIGGGGSQSARFHGAYQLWTRNLFDAVRRDDAGPAPAIRAPVVKDGQRLLVIDREEVGGLPHSHADAAPHSPESQMTWLEAIGLHTTTKYRAFVVLDAAQAAAIRSIPDSRLYEPFTSVITRAGAGLE
jgi:hypothetical protein